MPKHDDRCTGDCCRAFFLPYSPEEASRMSNQTKSFLQWQRQQNKETHESPKTPQTPDRATVKLFDAHGREIEMRRQIGFAPKRGDNAKT